MSEQKYRAIPGTYHHHEKSKGSCIQRDLDVNALPRALRVQQVLHVGLQIRAWVPQYITRQDGSGLRLAIVRA